MSFLHGRHRFLDLVTDNLRDLNLATWATAIAISRRHPLPQTAAAASYSGWLGFLCGILALLIVSTYPSWLQSPLQQVIQQLGQLLPLPSLLAVSMAPPSRMWGAIAMISTGLAFTQMILILMQSLTLIYGGKARRNRPRWRIRCRALALTMSLMTTTGLGFYLLETSQAQAITGWLTYGLRTSQWLLAWGIFSAGYALFYRFGPNAWPTGGALLPGACITGGGSLLGLAGLHGLTGVLNLAPPAIADLGRLMGWSLLIYANLLLVLLGATLNLAISQHRLQRRYHPPVPPLTTAPPPFESFTIRRRGDRQP